jgi:DNA invertase Pin-like site-specific DNA recombinase
MHKQAVAYIRTSTTRQNLGLDAQAAAITAFAGLHGFEIAATFSEQESGSDDHRPELAAALDQAKKLKAPIIVAKLDRLSRDVAYIAGLMKSRVPLSSPNSASTPTRSRCTYSRPCLKKSVA